MSAITMALTDVSLALLVVCGRDGAGPKAPAGPHADHELKGGERAASPTSVGHTEHGGSATTAAAGHATVDLPLGRAQTFGIRTVAVANEEITRTLRTTGVVRTDETRESTVRTKWSGWIEDVQVAFVGQNVRRGDSLFRAYSPELVVAQEE